MPFYFLLSALAVAAGTLITPVPLVLLLLFLVPFTVVLTRYSAFHFHPYPLLICITLGLLYGSVWLQLELTHRLPLELDKHRAELSVVVIEVEPQATMTRLLLQVRDTPQQLRRQGLPPLRRLRLNYYQTDPALTVNSILTVQALLRSPRNLANDLAFDYEAWLVARQIDATGYVRKLTLNVGREEISPSWRTAVLSHAQSLHSPAAWPWLAGLIFGEQGAFSTEQWRLAKSTGTLHLLVVSGMHLGLVVLLALLLWHLFLRLYSVVRGQSLVRMVLLRALFLLAVTSGYLWLAGAGVALQRAWIMLAVVLMLHSTRLNMNWLSAICVAALLLVLNNPLVWLSAGFSYSFTAVASLLIFFQGRRTGWLQAVWLPQWVVFLALLPLFIYWQQPVSFTQCLANLVAIPLVSLVLMPLALLNVLLPQLGLDGWLVVAGEGFWQWLGIVNNIPLSKLTNLPVWMLWIWPVWLLLLQRGIAFWPRTLMLMLVLLVVFVSPRPLTPKAMMLDVGQGQALVFTTTEQALVYDTGPAFGEFDSGEAIVKPVLERLNVRHIDLLVVSHKDMDHSGGTSALLQGFAVTEWWGGQYLPKTPVGLQLCQQASARWQVLDTNLLYRYLMLSVSNFERLAVNSNNQSCVVQLQWYGQRYLLLGDVGRDVEYELVRRYGHELHADVLVLAHHGSKTSSSDLLLRTVAPKEVWISAGFNNRFNHPAPEVLARLQQLDIPWYVTAQQGAIWRSPNGTLHTMRQGWQPPWRQTLE